MDNINSEEVYSLIDSFGTTQEVKAFTVLGRTLKGKILNRYQNCILLQETQTNRQAYINLDHVISITGNS